jgi:hypothetical protein
MTEACGDKNTGKVSFHPEIKMEWAGEGYQTTERMYGMSRTPLWSPTLHGGISSI